MKIKDHLEEDRQFKNQELDQEYENTGAYHWGKIKETMATIEEQVKELNELLEDFNKSAL